MGLMDVVNQALLCNMQRVQQSDEARCSTCGDVKPREEYYVRISATRHPNGRKDGPAGSIVQPCRSCKLIYEANKRKARRDAKH